MINESELKEIQLGILDDVARFCAQQSIRYFLAYGTLIGAVRHKGYIPWDDDIDIAMPRPDYDRFIKEYHSGNGVYEVICHSNCRYYGLPFAKVYHNGTVMNETLYKRDMYGVYIDVFPIDGFKSEHQVNQCYKLRRLLNAKKARWQGDRSFVKKVLIVLAKIVYASISVNKILDKIDRISREGNYESCEKVGYLSSLNGMKDIVDKDLIAETIECSFESHKYNIPTGYDEYLNRLYGDYMQIPPEQQRLSTHVFEAWWK